MRVNPPQDPGLCATCIHARLVPGARSTFVLCELADTDKRFPRYPPLPVRRCDGYAVNAGQATRR